MFIDLKNEYMLRKEVFGGVLVNIHIEQTLKKIIKMNPIQYKLLYLLCTGHEDTELLGYLSNSFGKEKADVIWTEFMKRINDYIVQIDNKPGGQHVLNSAVDIVPESLIKSYQSSIRLSSPLVMSLIITKKCLCQCQYCFTCGGDNSSDSLSTQSILSLLEEAKKIGIANVNLTGGDPFAHKDIMEILKKMVDLGLHFNVSTKKIFNDAEFDQLCNTGIEHIQFSLDSESNSTNKRLLCIDNYGTNMLSQIEKSVQKGMNPTVNIVATAINIDEIPQLVNTLSRIGVKKVYISPYLKSLGRHSDDFFPSLDQYKHLEEFIKNTHDISIDYIFPKKNNYHHSVDSMNYCTAGRAGMVVYPDGTYGICERIINPDLIKLNVNDNSILSFWYSEDLKSIIEPDRKKYAGTKCEKCDKFQQCAIEKGICLARSKMHSKSYFSEDPLCERNDYLGRYI